MVRQLCTHCADAVELAAKAYTRDPNCNPRKQEEKNVAHGDIEEEDSPWLVKFAPPEAEHSNESKVDMDTDGSAKMITSETRNI